MPRAHPRATELTVGRAKTRTSGINGGCHQSSHTHFVRGESHQAHSRPGNSPIERNQWWGPLDRSIGPRHALAQGAPTELTVGQVTTCTSGINCGLSPPLAMFSRGGPHQAHGRLGNIPFETIPFRMDTGRNHESLTPDAYPVATSKESHAAYPRPFPVAWESPFGRNHKDSHAKCTSPTNR